MRLHAHYSDRLISDSHGRFHKQNSGFKLSTLLRMLVLCLQLLSGHIILNPIICARTKFYQTTQPLMPMSPRALHNLHNPHAMPLHNTVYNNTVYNAHNFHAEKSMARTRFKS